MKTEKKINKSIYSNSQYLKLLHTFHKQKKSLDSLKSLKYISSGIKKVKPSSEIPLSIKPIHCSVPKDVNLHQIFINMINSSFKINNNSSIYSPLTEEENTKRNIILNTIKSFLKKSNIQKTMASIIYLYDILTFKNKDKNGMLNMEEIGVGAASLTIKFVFGRKKEIVKILQYFEENFEMNLDINNIEIICLKYINYYLSFVTPISFMEILFINGIIFSNDKIIIDDSGRIYDLALDIIEKIMRYSNEYIKYNPLCLCACVVSFARDIYHLEKWPNVLVQAFSITFNSFENIYNEYKELILKSEIRKKNLKQNSSLIKNKIENEDDKIVVSNNMTNYKEEKNINMPESGYMRHRCVCTDLFSKNKNKSNIYKNINNKVQDREDDLNIKKVEEFEVPVVKGKKYIYKSNNISQEKFNYKRIITKNREEEYSNAPTSENSNHFHNKINPRMNFSYYSRLGKNQKLKNRLYESVEISINSSKNDFKFNSRLESIKKPNKKKIDNSQECIFQTESKPNIKRRIYK